MQIHQTTYLTWMQRWIAEISSIEKQKKRSEISSCRVIFKEKMNFSTLCCFYRSKRDGTEIEHFHFNFKIF